jgi:TetR/AcrR family transcriptional regulator, fatty acid metabolism regulator protein
MTAPSEHVSLKERQRQEREQLILQTAEELLLEKGYHETSIDEIAARVGISKGTVYLHFDSKEELIFALLHRHLRQFQQALYTILEWGATPRDTLQAILDAYGGVAGRQRQLFGAVFQSPELRGRLIENRHVAQEYWDDLQRRIGAVMEQGKVEGEFDPSIPTPVMLAIFGSLLMPHAYNRLVAQGQMTPEELTRQVSCFFFKGIAAERPRAGEEGDEG